MSDIADSDGERTDEGGSIGTILGGGVTTFGDAEVFGSGGTSRGGLQLRIGI